MIILEQWEREARQWTTDELGKHVQFGDLLEEVIDAAAEQFDLFRADDLAEALEPVLTKDNGDDRVTVKVVDVRNALDTAGILAVV